MCSHIQTISKLFLFLDINKTCDLTSNKDYYAWRKNQLSQVAEWNGQTVLSLTDIKLTSTDDDHNLTFQWTFINKGIEHCMC